MLEDLGSVGPVGCASHLELYLDLVGSGWRSVSSVNSDASSESSGSVGSVDLVSSVSVRSVDWLDSDGISLEVLGDPQRRAAVAAQSGALQMARVKCTHTSPSAVLPRCDAKGALK